MTFTIAEQSLVAGLLMHYRMTVLKGIKTQDKLTEVEKEKLLADAELAREALARLTEMEREYS